MNVTEDNVSPPVKKVSSSTHIPSAAEARTAQQVKYCKACHETAREALLRGRRRGAPAVCRHLAVQQMTKSARNRSAQKQDR